MRRLYTYAPLQNTVMQEGLLTPLTCHDDLHKYWQRAGSEKKEDVLVWLESTLEGRSRSVSCLTEPIRWQGNDPMLQSLVERSEFFSYDLDALLQDNLIEKIYCKDGSDANSFNENFYEITDAQIDFSPLTWEKCSREKGLLYAVVRHYMLVLREGFIPPSYIKSEK